MVKREMRLKRETFGWKAVSPLLATIILIAITVAAGLMIYSLFFNTAGTMSSQLNIQIVSIDLVRTSSTGLFSATIKNSGNKPISGITVTVFLDSGNASLSDSSITLQPGQVWSNSTTFVAASATVGRSYPVKISITASDNSTLAKSLVVTCNG